MPKLRKRSRINQRRNAATAIHLATDLPLGVTTAHLVQCQNATYDSVDCRARSFESLRAGCAGNSRFPIGSTSADSLASQERRCSGFRVCPRVLRRLSPSGADLAVPYGKDCHATSDLMARCGSPHFRVALFFRDGMVAAVDQLADSNQSGQIPLGRDKHDGRGSQFQLWTGWQH